MQQTDQIDQHQSLLLVANERIPADTLDQLLIQAGKLNNPDTLILDTQDNPGIDEIRGLKEFLKTQPIYQSHKLVIILAAEALNHISQNALLKILEEPPESAKIILTTTNPAKLLPTIQSRLKQIFLESNSSQDQDKEILRFLDDLKSQTLGERMISLETVATKEKLLTLLNQLIIHYRRLLKESPSKTNLFNLTVCLYCLQMTQANVNPKGISDYLALKLQF